MGTDQTPSATQFVIHPNDLSTSEVKECTKDFVSLEMLPSPDEPVWVLSIKDKGESSREAWEHLISQLGSVVAAYPVLIDPKGNPQYPTGRLTVRFTKALTEEELSSFSSEYDLDFINRNKFVPSQVTFAPHQPAKTFLPDMIDKLRNVHGVSFVWPETFSKYKRR